MKKLLLILILALPLSAAASEPPFFRVEWPVTDFERMSVPWSEIRSGGPPRDGIPALDEVSFYPAAAHAGLDDREPVITLELEGETPRAYPIRYLTWHEIVNDTVGMVPVAVTFCPLCNSAITFDRRVAGQVLSFGVTGKLRHSDMIMYDRETESWWQQAVGEGIAGELMGAELSKVASWMEPWGAFQARNPDGLVMAEPAWNRDYGRNPYEGYDSADWPFLYTGDAPPHGIDPMARVVSVGNRAWPMARLAREGQVSEAGLVLDWQAGMASALDTARISGGRDVGHIRVRDAATGEDVPHDLKFAFAFHAFHPDGEWMLD